MYLQNKIINFLGDSITEGGNDEVTSEYRYDSVIFKEYQLQKANNYGVRGTRIAYQHIPSKEARKDLYFCGRAQLMDKSADIITILGGTNDYGHGDAPLGVPTDKTPLTFYGAVDYLINTLKATYPNAAIVFMTPIRRHGDEKPSTIPQKTGNNPRPLIEYVNIIKEKCEEYKIPVLDLYHEFPINPNIEEHRRKYTADGLHLNKDGHALLAKALAKFLIKL